MESFSYFTSTNNNINVNWSSIHLMVSVDAHLMLAIRRKTFIFFLVCSERLNNFKIMIIFFFWKITRKLFQKRHFLFFYIQEKKFRPSQKYLPFINKISDIFRRINLDFSLFISLLKNQKKTSSPLNPFKKIKKYNIQLHLNIFICSCVLANATLHIHCIQCIQKSRRMSYNIKNSVWLCPIQFPRLCSTIETTGKSLSKRLPNPSKIAVMFLLHLPNIQKQKRKDGSTIRVTVGQDKRKQHTDVLKWPKRALHTNIFLCETLSFE